MDLGSEKFTLSTMCRMDAAGQEGRPRDQVGGRGGTSREMGPGGLEWWQWGGEKWGDRYPGHT